jgi:hypothetical protein
MGQVTARTREVSDACSKVSRLQVCVSLSISISLSRLQVLAINPHTKGTQSVKQSVCVCVRVCLWCAGVCQFLCVCALSCDLEPCTQLQVKDLEKEQERSAVRLQEATNSSALLLDRCFSFPPIFPSTT